MSTHTPIDPGGVNLGVVIPYPYPPIRPVFPYIRGAANFNFGIEGDLGMIKRLYATIGTLRSESEACQTRVNSRATPMVRVALQTVANLLSYINEAEAVVANPDTASDARKGVHDAIMTAFYATYELNVRLRLQRTGLP